MPLDVEFNYPAPIAKPRPVKAVLDGMLSINFRTNEVTAPYYEYHQPLDANGVPQLDGAPVRGTERKALRIFLSDTQLQQIFGIIGPEVAAQGSLAAGSAPVITSK